MTGDRYGIRGTDRAKIFGQPEIFCFYSTCESQFLEVDLRRQWGRMPVEDADCF